MRFSQVILHVLILLQIPSAGDHPSNSYSKHGFEKVHSFPVLDTNSIHALYMDGEFEPAIEKLERAISLELLKSHADSVFAYKHLGVMYAARYETMEKGKGYMYRLLTIEPTVKIMDMYASEMIYMIFRNVQAEFQLRTADPKSLSEKSPSPVQTDSAKVKHKGPQKHYRTWPYWTAGALTLVGAGVAVFYLAQDHPSPSRNYSGGL